MDGLRRLANPPRLGTHRLRSYSNAGSSADETVSEQTLVATCCPFTRYVTGDTPLRCPRPKGDPEPVRGSCFSSPHYTHTRAVFNQGILRIYRYCRLAA
jgi:hypothetical protein